MGSQNQNQIILIVSQHYHWLYISFLENFHTYCLEQSYSKVHQQHQTCCTCKIYQHLYMNRIYSVTLLTRLHYSYLHSFEDSCLIFVAHSSVGLYQHRLRLIYCKKFKAGFHQPEQLAHRFFKFVIIQTYSKMVVEYKGDQHRYFYSHQMKPFGFEGNQELSLRLRLQLYLENCICILQGSEINNSYNFKTIMYRSKQSFLFFVVDLFQIFIFFNHFFNISPFAYLRIINLSSTLMTLYILFESSIGYGLFQLKEFDEVNSSVAKVQKEVKTFQTFSKIAQLKAFYPFESSQKALTMINQCIAGKAPQQLIDFLTQNYPLKKKSKTKLGVSENKLASSINQALQIQTTTSAVVLELLRGMREHFLEFLKHQEFQNIELEQSRLGLAHTFSRNKIALDVNRQDKPIIQSIGLLELLDKDINTFSMRVKEWYSWHFPQLARIVSDNHIYVQTVQLFGDRATSTATVQQIQQIVGDGQLAERIFDASKNSMGQQISEFDIECLKDLCVKTLKMFEFRRQIQEYLKGRMQIVAPNLTQLIGQTIAAKLISHSGSLSTLSKYPASTIQILGAQKALFRALKQKTKTPKYGLLYNTSFIGRAMGKNKGKISRFLANKCAMAARLDNYLVNPTNKFGEKLKEQVQRRLTKVDNDEQQPEKNEELMDEIMQELREEKLYFDSEQKFRKYQKKLKKSAKVSKAAAVEQVEQQLPKKKKKITKQ